MSDILMFTKVILSYKNITHDDRIQMNLKANNNFLYIKVSPYFQAPKE